VGNKAAKFALQRNDCNWETLPQCRKIACICAVFKAYMGKWAWKAISGRVQTSCCLSMVNHDKKIRSRKQRADIRKYSFVNRTVELYLQML
jgi:hypothetical protein